MMRSEEKLTIEVGLFYKVWVCDAHLKMDRREVSLKYLAETEERKHRKKDRPPLLNYWPIPLQAGQSFSASRSLWHRSPPEETS